MRYYTDDPVRDAERYYRDMDAEAGGFPVCEDCGEHIQDETAYYIEGHWICPRCIHIYEREVTR